MARIAGVDLPPNKRLEVGLTYIFGIGHSLSKKILSDAGVNPEQKVRELNDEDTTKIRKLIEEDYRIEGDLRKEVSFNVKRLTGIPPSPRPSREGTANPYERPHPQGPEAWSGRGPEEGDGENLAGCQRSAVGKRRLRAES